MRLHYLYSNSNFHFKNLSNDRDKPSPSTLGENSEACSLYIPDAHGPKKHVSFFMKLLVFCTPNFTYQEVQKSPVKNFNRHTVSQNNFQIFCHIYFVICKRFEFVPV